MNDIRRPLSSVSLFLFLLQIIRDFQTNKCKGYGFVTMAVYEEALAAITHLHGTTLGSRVLQVSFKAQTGRKSWSDDK